MPRDIIVDSGPLMTYIALRYLERTGAAKANHDRIFAELRPDSLFFAEREQARLRNLGKIHATPHVLAEIFRFRKMSALIPYQQDLRLCALGLLTEGAIIEIPAPIAQFYVEPFSQLICDFGLTDAALMFVAAQRRALLLTDDRRLFSAYSAGAGYQIRLLDDYLRE